MSTEFNSNLNIGAVPQVQPPVAVAETKPAVEPEKVPEAPVQTDVPKGQEAVAGQSQIKTDNIKSDMAAFCGNPQVIALSDQFFDVAYAQLQAENDPEAYEKACLYTSQFVNECVKK